MVINCFSEGGEGELLLAFVHPGKPTEAWGGGLSRSCRASPGIGQPLCEWCYVWHLNHPIPPQILDTYTWERRTPGAGPWYFDWYMRTARGRTTRSVQRPNCTDGRDVPFQILSSHIDWIQGSASEGWYSR